MKHDTIKIGAEVDRETDLTLRSWSRAQGRSKKRHAAVMLRKVSELKRANPDAISQMSGLDVLRRLEIA